MLYSFLVIYFAQYKEYFICLIPFSKFSDVLPASICARATGNLWSICIGVNIFSPFSCDGFKENVLLLTALRVNSWPS